MIEVTDDFMLLKRKMKSKDLAKAIGITPANLSILKTGKAHGVRFDTLSKICEALDCQSGDLLKYVPDDEGEKMKNKNEFSALKLFISMLIAWAIVFVGAWASKGFSADFFAMPRFTIVLVVSVAGAIIIGPAIYGFLYIGRRHDK